jgi:hypothetical protein
MPGKVYCQESNLRDCLLARRLDRAFSCPRRHNTYGSRWQAS